MIKNFQPTFWSKHIQTELRKKLILANWCDYKFEGEIQHGKKVKILGINRPTIKTYTPNSTIDFEQISDNSQFLEITERDYFALTLDDVDKAQSTPGILDKAVDEATYALADKADAFVGSLAQNAGKISASTKITSNNALEKIDDGIQWLWENNVPTNAEIAFEVTPRVYMKIKGAVIEAATNNVEEIKKGIIARTANAVIRLSNNIYNDGTDDYCMLRTRNAIAFANSIDKIEAGRHESKFGEYVKGLHVYGAKVVRPQELYVLKANV